MSHRLAESRLLLARGILRPRAEHSTLYVHLRPNNDAALWGAHGGSYAALWNRKRVRVVSLVQFKTWQKQLTDRFGWVVNVLIAATGNSYIWIN